MSFDTLAWAGKQRCDKPAIKLVLLALASCAGAEHDAHPSTAWLVEFTGLDRKTVIAAVDKLEAAGLVADTGERKGSTKQVKVYRLAVESIPKTEPSQKRNPPVSGGKGSQKRDTEPVRTNTPQKATPSSERARKLQPAMELPDSVPAEAWEGFVEMRKRTGHPLTPRAAQLALKGLMELAEDGHPPGDVLDQSTLNGWRGLFPLKDHHNDNHRNGSFNRPPPSKGGGAAYLLGQRRAARMGG